MHADTATFRAAGNLTATPIKAQSIPQPPGPDLPPVPPGPEFPPQGPGPDLLPPIPSENPFRPICRPGARTGEDDAGNRGTFGCRADAACDECRGAATPGPGGAC